MHVLQRVGGLRERPMKLNPDQQKAAETLSGHVLVTAGAGSGKTRVLAERFANAVLGSDEWEPAQVAEVAAITFTEKAAGELAERVRRTLRAAGLRDEANDVDAAWISTIHGLCARILRRWGLDIGLDPAFGVADGVTAGGIRERAFEDAATAALSEDPRTERLFGDYGFDEVFGAVMTIASELRGRGWTAERLVAEEVSSAGDVLGLAKRALRDTVLEIEACAARGKTVEAHLFACRDAEEALGALREEGDRELAEGVWRALETSCAVAGRPAAAAREMLFRARDKRIRLTREAAACAAAPGLAALVDLTTAYLDRYEELKREQALLDFEDLQSNVARLLGDPIVAERIASRFRLMMVDEFQDTDELQLGIVEKLAPRNLCTVGDEQQSIYGFRGADVSVYRRHADEMHARSATSAVLKANYRSHPQVLALVNAVFGSDVFFGERLVRLEAGREEPETAVVPGEMPRSEYVVVDRQGRGDARARAAMAEHLASRFAELRDLGVQPAEMVVLLRGYGHATEYADALRRHGFAVVVIGGRRFFDLRETAMMSALCDAIANPGDDDAFATLLASDFGDVSDDALWRLAEQVRHGSAACLWEAANAEDVLGEMAESDANALRRIAAAVDAARADLGMRSLAELLLRAVEHVDLDLRLLGRGDDGRESYANVLKFARLADAFEESGGAGPAGFVAYLEAKRRYGDHESPATLSDDGSPAVRIMSIHASKGLEFPVVAVPEVGWTGRGNGGICRTEAEGDRLRVALRLPSGWRTHDKESLDRTPAYEAMRVRAEEAEAEESQRLLYVAATRARELLILGDWRRADVEDGRDDVAGELSRALGLAGPLEVGERTLEIGHEGESALLRLSVIEQAEEQETAAAPEKPRRTARPLATSVPTPTPSAEPKAARRAPERLSYSSFAAYERCGLRFYARSVLHVGELPGPAGGGATGFGSAVHATLELWAEEQPNGARLDALARHFELDAEGRVRLERAVRAYSESDIAARVQSEASVRREAPFALLLETPGGREFVLDGNMDVYCVGGGHALIVDYKTGASGDAQSLQSRYRLQAQCYALAALRDGRDVVEVVFVRPEALDDEGKPQQVTFRFAAEDADPIERELLGLYERMEAGEYEPLSAWEDQLCADCPIAFGACPVRPGVQRAAG